MSFVKFLGIAALTGAVLTLGLVGPAAAQDAATADAPVSAFNAPTENGYAHFMPTVAKAHAMRAAAAAGGVVPFSSINDLSYTLLSPVMQTGVRIYPIIWAPPTLQNGSAAVMSATYQTKIINFTKDIGEHGLYNIMTQYYQTNSVGAKQYIANNATFGGSYVDTDPYPIGTCTYTHVTPPIAAGNCISNAAIQAEVTKVQGIKGWTNAINHIFMVFTAKGEGSCFTGGACAVGNQAYGAYCAYHSAFGLAASPTIYSNEPFGEESVCLGSGKEPNGVGLGTDPALTAASHELAEAVTDPLLNAWYVAAGANAGMEIGDLCGYAYTSADVSAGGIIGTGTNSWDSAKANQMYNGRFYELQTEYSNHTSQCLQVGP